MNKILNVLFSFAISIFSLSCSNLNVYQPRFLCTIKIDNTFGPEGWFDIYRFFYEDEEGTYPEDELWFKITANNFDKICCMIYTVNQSVFQSDKEYFCYSVEIFDNVAFPNSIDGRRDVFFTNYYGPREMNKIKNHYKGLDDLKNNLEENYDFDAPYERAATLCDIDVSNKNTFYLRIKRAFPYSNIVFEGFRYLCLGLFSYYDSFNVPIDEFQLLSNVEDTAQSYKLFRCHPYRDISGENNEDCLSIISDGDFRLLHYRALSDETKTFTFNSDSPIETKMFDYMPIGRNDNHLICKTKSSIDLFSNIYTSSLTKDFKAGDEIFIRINGINYSSVNSIVYNVI